ncbi:MAG: hypothetical protein MUC94_06520 [bacterium]|nr:hypothetical protein [bacterium]
MIDIEKIIQHNVGDALKKLEYDFDPSAITLERHDVDMQPGGACIFGQTHARTNSGSYAQQQFRVGGLGL